MILHLKGKFNGFYANLHNNRRGAMNIQFLIALQDE